MVFHEIYGCYYRAVAEIIRKATAGELTERILLETVNGLAFSESFKEIVPALKEQRWPLITGSLGTPIRHAPSMPLTLLEKRWLKAITLDPRFKLFGLDVRGLEDVSPLFTPDDFVVFDKYADGDPYDDEEYVRRFRTVLRAMRERRTLGISYVSRKGELLNLTVKPQRLEYSEKDDKFRLIREGRHSGSINLNRILKCDIAEARAPRRSARFRDRESESLTFTLIDERNALERAMLHFAHFEKRVERADGNRYRVEVKFDRSDETELLIRVLSFGPLIRVDGPEYFVELIRERLKKQIGCGL